MTRLKEHVLIIILALLALPYTLNFIHEVQEDYHDLPYLLLEGAEMLLALLGIALLVYAIHQRQRESEAMRQQLQLTRHDLIAAHADLQHMHKKIQQASSQYGVVIREQLNAWQITPSEREVALLLLKGLSFEEIASIRDTKEKTVRQQATVIYRKSGLSGRHEFAAWFFEDFLG